MALAVEVRVLSPALTHQKGSDPVSCAQRRQCGGRTGASRRVRRAGLPVASSLRSALPRMRTIARDATNRSGSGSQRRLRWPDPGQMDEVGVVAEDEVGERPPGDVRRDDAMTGVPAGPAEPGRAVEVHGHRPVARDAERAAPVVRDLGRRGGREVAPDRPARGVTAPRRCARSRRRSAGSAGRARRARRSRSGRRACAARRRTGGACRSRRRRPSSRSRPRRAAAAARWRSSASRAAGSAAAAPAAARSTTPSPAGRSRRGRRRVACPAGAGRAR